MIIGCGASAVVLLAALAQGCLTTNAPLLSVRIIDDNPSAPRGLAYGCNNPSLILNVPALRMGAYIDNPAHFYQWLQQTRQWRQLHPDFAALQIQPDDFVPRMIYGEYLHQLFRESIVQLENAGHNVELVAERVVAVKPADGTGGNKLRIVTSHNKNFPADTLVIATGNYPAFQNPVASHSIFSSPYCRAASQCDWKTLRDLIILGSGLSMVDAIQLAISRGYTGRFHIFSSHSLLPLAHADSQHQSALPAFQPAAKSAGALVREMRGYIKANQQRGIAWQDSINQLRTQNNYIWSELTVRERARIRRVLPWWNIARHRIPVEIYRLLQTLIAEQRLQLHNVKIKRIDAVANGFQLTCVKSDGNVPTRVRDGKIKVLADKAIICAGYLPGFRYAQLLCTDLLKDENQLQAELGKPAQQFRISISYDIYGIGPALGGVVFETTAIHEIRQQAKAIAVSVMQ